ncbi:Nucleotide-binding universal stress protein, UspA family [Nitrosospira sp. Nl5]|uniref:universal stress protein n=1 Tax=Nitrosospira sp. Nl5 TaxID=200120 RepID=UPI0008883374|nr:universal stress protein [Nitrosospira sp. Nl5]SCY18854.1 Nucleotide-binding universal stress protein, UspA family [Nitrosospira sp. Nl5]
MLKFLLPVDGSDTSNRAVAEFIKLLDWYREKPEIHLLNVQFPQRGNVALFIDKESIDLYHREEGMKGLQAARRLLDRAGIACGFHITVGNPEEMIVRYAKEIACDQIVIGPRGFGAVRGLLLGSVASKVMQLSTVPVLLIK